jgi:hypothetical protein
MFEKNDPQITAVPRRRSRIPAEALCLGLSPELLPSPALHRLGEAGKLGCCGHEHLGLRLELGHFEFAQNGDQQRCLLWGELVLGQGVALGPKGFDATDVVLQWHVVSPLYLLQPLLKGGEVGLGDDRRGTRRGGALLFLKPSSSFLLNRRPGTNSGLERHV